MEYVFKLEWEELDLALRNAKIDEWLTNLSNEEPDTHLSRKAAENYLKAHFPIYF